MPTNSLEAMWGSVSCPRILPTPIHERPALPTEPQTPLNDDDDDDDDKMEEDEVEFDVCY